MTSETTTHRREFIGTLAASAITLAGAACAAPASAIQSAATPATPASPVPRGPSLAPKTWDNSWFARLTAKHKAVFDTPEIVEDSVGGPGQAVRFMNGVHEALGVEFAEIQTVVVIRHKAIPFIFNDAMWAKYKIGEVSSVKDGGKPATRNTAASGRPGRQGDDARPQGNIAWLTAHGHIVLGCDLATQGYASKLAEVTKGTMAAIYAELAANLAPGVILQPNGIYATLRAQEAGCAFMRSA